MISYKVHEIVFKKMSCQHKQEGNLQKKKCKTHMNDTKVNSFFVTDSYLLFLQIPDALLPLRR